MSAIGQTKDKSRTFRLRFIMLEVVVLDAPAKSSTALATVKSKPKKFKIGIKVTPDPAPPMEKTIENIKAILL